jgi:hypothetical protein
VFLLAISIQSIVDSENLGESGDFQYCPVLGVC